MGLLSRAERKNCWQLAGIAGDASPEGMQWLLNVSPWEEDAARDALACCVVKAMGDPAAVLAVDETGFLKKGRMPAGPGCIPGRRAGWRTAGSGVHGLCHAGRWAGADRPGAVPAGEMDGRPGPVPEGRDQRRRRLRDQARAGLDDGRPRAGSRDPVRLGSRGRSLRRQPEASHPAEGARHPYVMAMACSDIVAMPAGGMRADEAAALVPHAGWQRLRCAAGAKGLRLYDWALIGTVEGPGHQLLVRRSLQPGEKGQLELAFLRCWSPRPVTLSELTAVAGARWGIEDCFAEAKGEAGLGHYQVRRYRAWYRHATLAMLAHAFLAVTARASASDEAVLAEKGDPTPVDSGALRQGHMPRRRS